MSSQLKTHTRTDVLFSIKGHLCLLISIKGHLCLPLIAFKSILRGTLEKESQAKERRGTG